MVFLLHWQNKILIYTVITYHIIIYSSTKETHLYIFMSILCAIIYTFCVINYNKKKITFLPPPKVFINTLAYCIWFSPNYMLTIPVCTLPLNAWLYMQVTSIYLVIEQTVSITTVMEMLNSVIIELVMIYWW